MSIVVVIEHGGFCTSKDKKDVLITDTIVCEVNDNLEAEKTIHGKSKENYLNGN